MGFSTYTAVRTLEAGVRTVLEHLSQVQCSRFPGIKLVFGFFLIVLRLGMVCGKAVCESGIARF